MIRLDKYLCVCKVGSRTEVKKFIKQKLVTVNGIIASKPEEKVDENSDVICFKGKQLLYEQFGYYLLYKEAGYVTALTDATHKTVMEELPEEIRKGISPIGRLDKDTEGLLLFTNDGEFAHHIISPGHHIPKTYETELDVALPEDACERFAAGLDIGDDAKTLPAKLELLPNYVHENGHIRYCARVTIYEGRYHQVKRMFHAVGCKVLYLKRVSIGSLSLEGLAPGECRKLSDEEVRELKEY